MGIGSILLQAVFETEFSVGEKSQAATREWWRIITSEKFLGAVVRRLPPGVAVCDGLNSSSK